MLWHEDTYFNQVLLAYHPVVENLGYVGYIWKFSPNTITRKNNGEYTSKSMCMYIDALDKRLDRIFDLLDREQYRQYVVCDIVYMYCVLQDHKQLNVLNEVRESIENRLREYIYKNDPYLFCIDDCFNIQISGRIRDCMQTMVIIPEEGYCNFIKRLMI